jgi:hypothetical protein
MSVPGAGQVLNLLEVCAELVEKHGLLPEQIEKLDRWWISYVYFHPRGERGELKVSPKKKAAETPLDRFKAVGRSFGKPDWLIEFEWERLVEDARKGKG